MIMGVMVNGGYGGMDQWSMVIMGVMMIEMVIVTIVGW